VSKTLLSVKQPTVSNWALNDTTKYSILCHGSWLTQYVTQLSLRYCWGAEGAGLVLWW